MLIVPVLALAAAVQVPPPPASLLADGRLTEVSAIVDSRPWQDWKDPVDRFAACRVLTYENKLAEAEACLRTVPPDSADTASSTAMLAEVLKRERRWADAAAAYAAAGNAAEAARLQFFGHDGPYRFDPASEATIPFEGATPLPVVRARIDGGEERFFILDTGGGDTVIDPRVADEVGAPRFGEQSGVYAGGKKASSAYAAIESLTLGGITMLGVPVRVLDTSRFTAAAGGHPVSGVIGIGVFSQFLTTLDYPNSRLILQPKDRRRVGGARATALPMWLAGDHFVLVDGGVNDTRQLVFIDTGMAGAGCTAPQSTLAAAKLIPAGSEQIGMGGGGAVAVKPFVAPSIALGTVTVRDVPCFSGAFPPTLEHNLGTRVGLLASHDALKGFALSFDFGQMRLVLDPAP